MFTRTTVQLDGEPEPGPSDGFDAFSLAARAGDTEFPAPRAVADRLPCRVQNADLWFGETPAELNRAKQFCSECPVRLACLAGAITRREPWGVWGGEIFENGVIIARKRPRGRPRKHPREVAA